MSHDGGTSSQIPAEAARYDVNNKLTTLWVKGNKQKKVFLYSVQWVDSMNYYYLDCASKNLDQALVTKLIALAKKIDKALNQ